MQDAACVQLPFRDEAAIKGYLLHGDERLGQLAAQGVQVTSVKGALPAGPLHACSWVLVMHWAWQAAFTCPCTLGFPDAVRGMMQQQQQQQQHQQQQRGCLASAGAAGSLEVLQDRSFVCLHYRLNKEMQLESCLLDVEDPG